MMLIRQVIIFTAEILPNIGFLGYFLLESDAIFTIFSSRTTAS